MPGPTATTPLFRLKAGAIVGKSEGNAVAYGDWPDISGNGRNPIAGTGGTYRASALGGKPAVEFNGSGNYLQLPSVQPVHAHYSKIVVFKANGLGANQQNLLSGGGGAQPDQALWFDNSASLAVYHGSADRLVSNTATTSGTWNLAHATVADHSSAAVGETTLFHLAMNGKYAGMSGAASLTSPTNDPSVFLGSYGTLGAWLNGQIAEVMLYDQLLGGSEVNQLHDYVNNEYGLLAPMYAVNVLLVGDSITSGVGTSTASWAQLVAASLNTAQRTYVLNLGIGGMVLTEMDTEAVTFAPRLTGSYVTKNIAVIFGGTNDAYFGADGATMYSRQMSVAAKYRARGCLVLLVGMLPRTGLETQRQAFNTLTRANWRTIADGYVDVELLAMGAAGANTGSKYDSGDHTHPNDSGAADLAGVIGPAIQALIDYKPVSIVVGPESYPGSGFASLSLTTTPTEVLSVSPRKRLQDRDSIDFLIKADAANTGPMCYRIEAYDTVGGSFVLLANASGSTSLPPLLPGEQKAITRGGGYILYSVKTWLQNAGTGTGYAQASC